MRSKDSLNDKMVSSPPGAGSGVRTRDAATKMTLVVGAAVGLAVVTALVGGLRAVTRSSDPGIAPGLSAGTLARRATAGPYAPTTPTAASPAAEPDTRDGSPRAGLVSAAALAPQPPDWPAPARPLAPPDPARHDLPLHNPGGVNRGRPHRLAGGF